jgi:methionine-rich copper-binding protein CopC
MKKRNKAALFVLLMVIALSMNVNTPSYSPTSLIVGETGQFQDNAEVVFVFNETRANTYTADDQTNPSLCALTADTIAVAWQSQGQDGSGYGVYAAVFNATTGTNLTAEFRVNAYTTYSQWHPSVTALTADTFAVAWTSEEQDGMYDGVYAAVFNATTGTYLTAEFQVNTYTADDQQNPSLCALTADTIAVAWTSYGQDGSGYGVYAAVFNATTGAILTAEFRVNNYTTNEQKYPSVSALTADTFAVAWSSYEQDGSGYGVYAAVFNATTGAILTAEFRVNNYTTSEQKYPSVSALTADTFAVAWDGYEQDGSGYGVYASVFNATTGAILTAEFRVNNYTTSNQVDPSVSALTADTFAVAWSSQGQDGSGYGVYATVFNATTGTNMTAEFQLNNYTTNFQYHPSVSALNAGRFTVVWQSSGQDGSQYEIYFNLFDLVLGAPQLNPISPTPDVDGTIQLTWSAVLGASLYHVFRSTAYITDITGLVAITTAAGHSFTDILQENGKYFYVIVAEGPIGNSSISNCENVTITIPFDEYPFLHPILPESDDDGIIEIKWSKITKANIYYVFRDTSYITSTEELIPIAAVTSTNYTDHLLSNEYYYYAVVAGDGWINSSISNCQYVLVAMGGESSQPDYTWLFFLTIVAGFTIAGAIIIHGILLRGRSSVPTPSKKNLPPKPKN